MFMLYHEKKVAIVNGSSFMNKIQQKNPTTFNI